MLSPVSTLKSAPDISSYIGQDHFDSDVSPMQRREMLEFVDAPHQGPRDTEKTRRNELDEVAGGNAKTKAQSASSSDGPCKNELGKEGSGPGSSLWPRWV